MYLTFYIIQKERLGKVSEIEILGRFKSLYLILQYTVKKAGKFWESLYKSIYPV